MEHSGKDEIYPQFIRWLQSDLQKERSLVNRRMFSIVLWCFILPAILTLVAFLLSRFQLLPGRFRNYVDWIPLVFPVGYSIYVLFTEVLLDLPSWFKRGGYSSVLNQVYSDSEWRRSTCERMTKSLPFTGEQWAWIQENFETDILSVRHRSRYFTFLGGAVFYIALQGLDFLADDAGPVSLETAVGWANLVQIWVESISRVVSLGVFVFLLYLSGSQLTFNLRRYSDCLRLLGFKK